MCYRVFRSSLPTNIWCRREGFISQLHWQLCISRAAPSFLSFERGAARLGSRFEVRCGCEPSSRSNLLYNYKFRCISHAELAFFTLIANTSIVTLNLSLLFNTVSVYQARNNHLISQTSKNIFIQPPARWRAPGLDSLVKISKLLIVPCCAVLEWIVLGSVITQKSFIAMFLVILGVATVWVNWVQF